MYRLETKIIHTRDDCVSFAEQDLFDFMRNQLNTKTDILCIDCFEIHKEHRNKGYGTEMLKRFCEDNKESYVLFLIAGMPIEEAKEPSKEEVRQKLSKLEKFYKSIGFVNVNEKIGQYEQKIPFLYKKENKSHSSTQQADVVFWLVFYNSGTGEKIISKLMD